MEAAVLVVFLILLLIFVGVVASKYGRNFFGWFLLALVITPILGFIAVLIARHSKICPECKGGIHREAKRYRHCGANIANMKKYKIAISCSDREDPLRADYIGKVNKALKKEIGQETCFLLQR